MMKTEKIIRSQSRNSLSKGNWPTLVGCLAILLIVFFIIDYAYYLLLYAFDTVDFSISQFKETKSFLINSFYILFFIMLFAASPLINGFSKMCCSVAKTDNCTADTLFFYFKNPGLYFKAVGLNVIKCVFFILALSVCMIPAEVFSFAAEFTTGYFVEFFNCFAFIFTVLGIIASVLICIKLVFCNFVMAENENLKVFNCISLTFKISKGHTLDIFKLLLSFFFWILLCFFVFPVFYVVPYMGVSFANSAKWLIALKKEERPEQC